jgi:TIR domain-containing protein
MAHQIFISYSSKDGQIAQAICTALERAGIGCWIVPRDIVSSSEWGASIVAIQSSKAVLVVFSPNSNASPQDR